MSTTTIHQTVFTAMKSKIVSLEQRVRELEEENMALHLFKALGCDNDNLDELEYDDDNVSVVSDTVDTMVHILEMTHDEQEENEEKEVGKETCDRDASSAESFEINTTREQSFITPGLW